jgi:hypothetical protein
MNARSLLARTIQSTVMFSMRPVVRRLCQAVAPPRLAVHGRASKPVPVPVNQWDDAEEWS